MNLTIRKKIFEDFLLFSKKQLYSGDIDPAYPVLKYVQQKRGLSKQDALWHTLLYVAWYDLGSAEIVFRKYPRQILIDESLILRTGIERRGFRGNNKAVEMLNSVTLQDKLQIWVERVLEVGWIVGWRQMFRTFQTIKHNGSWAAYKWCDLLKHVNDYPITACDIGEGGKGEKAGPIPGMSLLTGIDRKLCVNNLGLQQKLYEYVKSRLPEINGLDQLETLLCDFNSLSKGSYYPGHDIDKQMEDLEGLPSIYWEARKASFPKECLGELNGWSGRRKHLKREYQIKGTACLI